MTTLPAVAQLHRAIAISEEIQKLEAELASILGSTGGGGEVPMPFSIPLPTADLPKTRGRKKGQKLSAETRAKMAAAQQARHAKTTSTAEPKVKGKRVISEEHRAKLPLAARKRWAKV